MCGITGIHHPQGVQQQMLKQMTDAIAHRGPDAEGFFIDGPFGLGHRRLSIIDLRETANQPMRSGNGRFWMVYNGEVYNYRQIATQLDVPLKTTGDSEVVLEAFVKWGPQMVHRLNGMFAIAIFDTLERKLFLFRDRMGIKPLFVYRENGILAFASELKAITAIGQLSFSVNTRAIPYFLHVGYIPEPLSIYREVEKFPAGCWAETDGTSWSVHRYWSATDKINDRMITNEPEAKAQLTELLQASVSRRLVSDVPFGTFLSGGIDSSVVTALAQKVSSERIKTFSIGFDDARHDESAFARQVAGHLGTDHHEYRVTQKDALELIEQMVPVYDEPYADSSAIPTMLVSKMARQKVTMTLSGDGGDELFHGYGMYHWAERLAHPLVGRIKWPLSKMLSLGNDRFRRIAKVFDTTGSHHVHAHVFSQEQYMFSEKEIAHLLIEQDSSNLPLLHLDLPQNRKLTAAERQALFDLQFYLKDDLLTKVDRASMRYSLEARVPLLDHTVVEFALNLDPALKVRNGVSKYLLKQVLYDHVPRSYFERPKWGFSIPLSRWLQHELAFMVDEYLSERTVEATGVVRWTEVRSLLQKWRSGETHLYNRIWLLIVLHQWFSDNRQRVHTV